MGKRTKDRLPEKQSSLVSTFAPRNDKQHEMVKMIKDKEVVIAIGSSGTGKAQPLHSKVYTPNGPIMMGDIKIGQEVCTPNGNTAIVTKIFPQGIKDYYRIHFSDNTTADCCSEHLWKVQTVKDRDYNQKHKNLPQISSILQTKDMIGSITIGTDSRKNYRIPITEPVFYNKQELPIHPYLLGVLIGDGGMTGTCTILSSKDLEILNKVNELIAEYGLEINPTLSTVKGEHCDYLLHQKDRSITKTNYITAETGKLGIRCKSEYKFIPNIYLYSSIKDRVELLQGLMDIDGTVDKRSGCPSFSTSSPTLKDNFCELVRSLGGIATISIKKTKSLDNYVININMPNNINIFKLSRKQNLVISKTKYITSRFITNIEYIGQTEQQCILINSEDHLYLTDNHIVTHNTFCALATALNLLGEKYKRIVLIKSVTTIPDEAIGFLPGSAEEKVEPFMMSFTWNIDKMCGKGSSRELMKKGLVEVLPIAFIRGLSIDNSIVIIDEAQNITSHTFKTIMTRIGEDSKYIFLGDVEQIDKKKSKESCLSKVISIFNGSEEVGTLEFTDQDCVRNPIIPKILASLREHEI